MKPLETLPVDLTSFIATTEEAAKTIDALTDILEGKYKVHANPFEDMKKVLPFPISSHLLSLYQGAEGNMANPQELYGFLDLVKHALQTLPTLSIQLAITPSQEVLENISAWVAKNLESPHLLQISVKQELIAGAAVGYQGRLKDFSLVKKLPEIVKN